MLPYTGTDLAAAFRGVRRHTIQIATDIPEAQYGFAPAPGSKTVAQLLTHIALSYRFQMDLHAEGRTTLQGFDFAALMARIAVEDGKVRTKADLLALLATEGERFATWLGALTDEFLCEKVAMMPGSEPASKTRFEMLLGVKEHEMHHRAQLMVIERLLGITPHLTRQRQEAAAAAAARR